MNSKRYVGVLVFGIIAIGSLAAHFLLKPNENGSVHGQAPQAGTIGEGASQSAQTPATVELGSRDIEAPFERETVVRLNDIVRRSLVAVRKYDAQIEAIRADVFAAERDEMSEHQLADARASLAKLHDLVVEASQALSDMKAAVAELEASDETYNAAILAGMVRFVKTVADEIGAEHARLEKQIV